MGKDLVISPKTIQSAEFNDKIQNFDAMLLRRREISRRVGEIENELHDLASEHDGNISESAPWDKALIYKPKSEVDDDAWLIVDSMYGKALMDTAVDPDVVRAMEKRFAGFAKFIELCHATFQEHKKGRRRPTDEAATKKFRASVAPLMDEKRNLLLEQRELETGIKDVEQYVDMFDKIARIGKSVKASAKDE